MEEISLEQTARSRTPRPAPPLELCRCFGRGAAAEELRELRPASRGQLPRRWLQPVPPKEQTELLCILYTWGYIHVTAVLCLHIHTLKTDRRRHLVRYAGM